MRECAIDTAQNALSRTCSGGAQPDRIGDRGLRGDGFSRRFRRCKRDRTAVGPERGSRRADVRRLSLSTVEGEVSEASWNARGGYRSKCPASSVHWRSLRPPNVVLGETRQLCRILVALTSRGHAWGGPAACR